jgi:hypothetical protein
MSEYHHWSSDHEVFIRRHFNEELGDEPIYIRSEHEAGLDPCPHACEAFTSTTLDLSMKVALQAHGRWYGRGFSVALPKDGQSFHRSSWPTQLNLVLHELAHHLADRPTTLVDADPPDDSHPLVIAERSDVPLFRHVNIFEHGPEFVRAALHVHRRASPDAGLYSMHIFSEAYRSPSIVDALRALDDELRHAGNIIDVCSTPAPAAFVALWPPDSERLSDRLSITRRILDSVWAAHGLLPATT